MYLLRKVLERVVRQGGLTLIAPSGRRYVIGQSEGPEVAIRFHDRHAARRIALASNLGLGEVYMDGRLTLEKGSIYDFLVLLSANIGADGMHPFHDFIERLFMLFRRIHQFNPAGTALRNVAHHYDLSEKLYSLFLDTDKQYSCAYFEDGNDDLEVAQAAKKRHIAAKLLVEPGQKVLDIGSGWGGLGLYLTQSAGAEVTGITLSEEQLKFANERAFKAGLQDRVRFHLRDYRKQTGKFQRIVSVGMFEHVGVGFFRAYFDKVRELLTEDGVALLHTIGRTSGPDVTDAWIRKYIFPGGYIPALSEIVPAIEKAGLVITDMETLGPHYAQTLHHWRQRFLANWERAAAIYDERFCRMWEFYLAGSEVSFRHLGLTVFQIQLAHDRGQVPMTRDYIADWERAHARPRDADERAA